MAQPSGAGQEMLLLRAMFDAAVEAALPAAIVPRHLPPPPRGHTIVLGAGKASAAMAKAVEDHLPGPLEGLVVTRYGHAVPCQRIEIVEAAHPVPDAPGRDAARRILELAKSAGPDDLVLCLISGGGSALLVLPAEGLTLEDKQAVNKALLASGADIGQMNVVRKHLSAIEGELGGGAQDRDVVGLGPAEELAVVAGEAPGEGVDGRREGLEHGGLLPAPVGGAKDSTGAGPRHAPGPVPSYHPSLLEPCREAGEEGVSSQGGRWAGWQEGSRRSPRRSRRTCGRAFRARTRGSARAWRC